MASILGWQVYVLGCADGTLYTGITNDLTRRLRLHGEGRASRYTRSRLPVKLVYSETAPHRRSALAREAAIKALPRGKKLALIAKGQEAHSQDRAVRGRRIENGAPGVGAPSAHASTP